MLVGLVVGVARRKPSRPADPRRSPATAPSDTAACRRRTAPRGPGRGFPRRTAPAASTYWARLNSSSGRTRRSDGAARRGARRRSAWPCRCPSRDTGPSSPSRRSRPRSAAPTRTPTRRLARGRRTGQKPAFVRPIRVHPRSSAVPSHLIPRHHTATTPPSPSKSNSCGSAASRSGRATATRSARLPGAETPQHRVPAPTPPRRGACPFPGSPIGRPPGAAGRQNASRPARSGRATTPGSRSPGRRSRRPRASSPTDRRRARTSRASAGNRPPPSARLGRQEAQSPRRPGSCRGSPAPDGPTPIGAGNPSARCPAEKLGRPRPRAVRETRAAARCRAAAIPIPPATRPGAWPAARAARPKAQPPGQQVGMHAVRRVGLSPACQRPDACGRLDVPLGPMPICDGDSLGRRGDQFQKTRHVDAEPLAARSTGGCGLDDVAEAVVPSRRLSSRPA